MLWIIDWVMGSSVVTTCPIHKLQIQLAQLLYPPNLTLIDINLTQKVL